MESNELLEAALAYVDMGLAVFPLIAREKKPSIKHGVNACSSDAAELRHWWEEHPRDNVAIACGVVSGGLMVIDLDVDEDSGKDGLETLRMWELEHGELPETARALTGSGGVHILYRVMGETPGNHVNKELGVDIRSDGGYIVAPPSVHPNGQKYEWEYDPEDYPIADADANVMAFVEYVSPQPKREPGERFELPETIGKGERNDTLFRMACSMQSRGESDEMIMLAVKALNSAKCKPPVGEFEVEQLVNSALGYDKGDAKKPKGEMQPASGKFEDYHLDLNQHGFPLNTTFNGKKVLNGEFPDRFYYDVRSYTQMLVPPLPWDDSSKPRAFNNTDEAALSMLLEQFGVKGKDKMRDSVRLLCNDNKRNTVTEWLESLEYQGDGYVGTLLPYYLGVEDDWYQREVMRLLMLGAIARAYDPGTKFDYMPVLVGKQGLGKSFFLRRLAHESEWFCDGLGSIEGDAPIEKLRGKWIVEMAELLATKKQKDVESIKAFITTQVDTIRPKYAAQTEDRPRGCVFCGTTNDSSFLTDATGNRRFLPIECHEGAPYSIFDDSADAWFDAAWAEALNEWNTKRPKLVLSAAGQKRALELQDAYTEDDPRVGMIQEYLDNRLLADSDPLNIRVCVRELTERALGDATARQADSKFLQNEVHKIMQSKILGWTKLPGRQRCGSYGVQRCYTITPEVIANGCKPLEHPV